jgi:hypothetical protein
MLPAILPIVSNDDSRDDKGATTVSQKVIDAQRNKERASKQYDIAWNNYGMAVDSVNKTATTDAERMVAARAQMEYRCATKAYSDASFELYEVECNEVHDVTIDEDALAFDKWWRHEPDNTND